VFWERDKFPWVESIAGFHGFHGAGRETTWLPTDIRKLWINDVFHTVGFDVWDCGELEYEMNSHPHRVLLRG
jgi:hypothetical protein